MKFTDSMLIFSLLIVSIYGAATDIELLPTVRPVTGLPTADISKHKTTSTTAAPAPLTPSSTESTSTMAPSSTAQPTTTTTSAPSTTTSTTTTSTTPKPTTPPTPTPEPTPTPDPEEGNWTLTEGNRTCILVEMATQLNVTYTTAENKTEYLVYNIPKDSELKPNGSCGNVNGTSDQFIAIYWSDKGVTNMMNMTFKLNHTTNEFSLNKVVFMLDKAIFPNDSTSSSHSYYHVGSFFETPKQNSYHCTRSQILNLTNSENSNVTIGTVSFSHTLLEAYHEGKKNKQFSTSIDCDAISTPDIVPIAVGIALIALVIIVLIAYVIGRRRSAQGYVSM